MNSISAMTVLIFAAFAAFGWCLGTFAFSTLVNLINKAVAAVQRQPEKPE